MNEKSLTVLEQYELKIKGTYRSKGNYGCTTDKGKYILQEYNNSDEKMKTMSVFYDFLEKIILLRIGWWQIKRGSLSR